MIMSVAGIVTIVLGEVTLATYCVSPVHRSKALPVRLEAATATCCPFVYKDPLPLPPLTVSL